MLRAGHSVTLWGLLPPAAFLQKATLRCAWPQRQRRSAVEMSMPHHPFLFQQLWQKCRAPGSAGAGRGRERGPPGVPNHKGAASSFCCHKPTRLLFLGLSVSAGASSDAFSLGTTERPSRVWQLEKLSSPMTSSEALAHPLEATDLACLWWSGGWDSSFTTESHSIF